MIGPSRPRLLNAYGATRDEAIARIEAPTLRVLAEHLERCEPAGELEGLFPAA